MLIKPLTTGGSIFKPPISKIVKVGYVVLSKNEAVGEHITRNKEEIIFIIEGTAEVHIGKEAQSVSSNNLIYIPPNTKHDLLNKSASSLKYIYFVGNF